MVTLKTNSAKDLFRFRPAEASFSQSCLAAPSHEDYSVFVNLRRGIVLNVATNSAAREPPPTYPLVP